MALHGCKAFWRLVLFSVLTCQARAAAAVHMALEQIFQRNRTWGHSTAVPSSPALQRQPLCLCSPLPPTPTAFSSNAMLKFKNFDCSWDSLRVKIHLLSQSWFASGRTQANPQHWHISTERWKWPSQAQGSRTSLCSLAVALTVSHLQHLEQGGWLTSLSWNWLKAQTAPRCQQERPLSGRLSTICSMVTVPFSVGGGQRIVGGALGIHEHQSYCTKSRRPQWEPAVAGA